VALSGIAGMASSLCFIIIAGAWLQSTLERSIAAEAGIAGTTNANVARAPSSKSG
jgi:hypothetical protein